MATAEAVHGAETAAAHADRVHGVWSDEAYEFLISKRDEFKREDKTFMTEDMRVIAERAGMPVPPDRRAWGAIVLRAKRQGVIHVAGFAPVKDRRSHGGPKYVWRFA